MNEDFARIVSDIPQIGIEWHGDTILENSRINAVHVNQTVRDIPPTMQPIIVVSAGPSLYRLKMLQRLKVSGFTGSVVATDGSYVQCLKAGIVPRYVVTLDPHPTRIVRWFGDPDFEANSAGDDYFFRQDLDEDFRKNAAEQNMLNIGLVNLFSMFTEVVISTTAPKNVVDRTKAFKRYWFVPLVDNPYSVQSLTRQMAKETNAPAINTGGTVGTAAIMFAHTVLKAKKIGVIGMDLGYTSGMELERTQSWNMLKDKQNVDSYYITMNHPKWGPCYVDPTYFWYRQNLLGLLKSAGLTISNCSGSGTLYGPHVHCCELEEFVGG